MFCNKQGNQIKIFHFDEVFWLYYHRTEHGRFRWSKTRDEALAVNYNKMATNELVSHVMALKHQYAIPIYRQENYLDMVGVTLFRQTLCNWTLIGAKVLEIIHNYIKASLLQEIISMLIKQHYKH